MFYFRIEIKINHIDEITNNEKKNKKQKIFKNDCNIVSKNNNISLFL